jgi:hypothetical protein
VAQKETETEGTKAETETETEEAMWLHIIFMVVEVALVQRQQPLLILLKKKLKKKQQRERVRRMKMRCPTLGHGTMRSKWNMSLLLSGPGLALALINRHKVMRDVSRVALSSLQPSEGVRVRVDSRVTLVMRQQQVLRQDNNRLMSITCSSHKRGREEEKEVEEGQDTRQSTLSCCLMRDYNGIVSEERDRDRQRDRDRDRQRERDWDNSPDKAMGLAAAIWTHINVSSSNSSSSVWETEKRRLVVSVSRE